MAEAKDPGIGDVTTVPDSTKRVQLGLRLQPVNHTDQPVFSNFTMVQGAPGMVFLDFGFLEPATLPSIARLAQSGGKMPESISGRLACRVVLGADTAAQLAQQLQQHLKKPAPRPGAGSKPPSRTTN